MAGTQVTNHTDPQGHSDLSTLQVPPTCVCKHHRFLKSCPASIQQGVFSSLLCVNISAGSGVFFRHPCWGMLSSEVSQNPWITLFILFHLWVIKLSSAPRLWLEANKDVSAWHNHLFTGYLTLLLDWILTGYIIQNIIYGDTLFWHPSCLPLSVKAHEVTSIF